MVLVCLNLLSSGPPESPAAMAAALVDKLGSARFKDREQAERDLVRIGTDALPAVRAGLKSADAEIRSRCQRIVAVIEEEERRRQDADLCRKARAYAEAAQAKGRQDLPLREAYEKLVGSGSSARKLYAQAVCSNVRLLHEVATDKSRGRQAYETRCRQLAEAPNAVETGELAALLLISAVLGDASDWNESASVSYLLGNTRGPVKAVRDGEHGKALRRLLVGWAEGQAVADLTSLQRFLTFVGMEKCKEGLPLVRRLIRDKGAAGVNLRAAGVAVLAEVGGKGVAAELQQLWDDETELFRSPDGHKARLQDHALGASIRLAGKDPRNYGVQGMNVMLKGFGAEVWEAPLYWFASNEDRGAAFKKWRAQAQK
jgi:hypothetical protein